MIDLGVAQSGGQFREAIATFTRGLEIGRTTAVCCAGRGHRYLFLREFDTAFADLTRASKLDPSIYCIWYHLGIVNLRPAAFFLRPRLAITYKAQPIARSGRARRIHLLA